MSVASRLTMTTPHGLLALRPETDSAEDTAFLFDLFCAVRLAEMALMPLDDAGRRFLLQAQFRSMTNTYRTNYPNARFEIATLDDTPIGRLITDVQPDCVHFVDIALLPASQGGGLATTLMLAALEEPRRLGVPGRVNVLGQNVASLRLCQRLGFSVNAQRPPFVELIWHA
jgi:GNAT superfamily N-acetyltransferase